MWDSLGVKLALAALFTVGLASCGGNDDGTSPASLRSSLLPASEIPAFKSERKLDWDNPIDFVTQGLLLPQATPPSQAAEVFENAGFEAGVGEQFVAAKGNPFEGPHGAEYVVQLGSDDEAREALDYARKEALKPPCFNDCSVQAREFAVPGIPGAKGVQLTPQPDPPPNAPPPFVAYSVGFTIESRLFWVNSDGEPGQAKKGQVLEAAKALYDRNAESDAERSAGEPAKSEEQPSQAQLTRFLMRKNEEPGFRPGARPGQVPRSRETITGVNAFVKDLHLAPADARRLRSEGFISFTAQPIRGPRTAGVTNVALYETAEGAKHSLAHELRPDVIRAFGPVENLRYFAVPGVPGARGWTASKPRVGNVQWVQGRCMLVLGNQGPGPFVEPLSTGARAIYDRTGGHCP
jgi:hypothetical protein